MRVVPLVLGSLLLLSQTVFAQIAERKDFTQDCSKAIQSIAMRFTQASSPDAHIWYLENGTNKNLIGATTVLYYYTKADRAWRVTVTGSVTSATGGHVRVSFLPSQLNTNSLNGDFDYLCKVTDGANQVLAVTKGTLTLDEDISATAGVGSLPAATNILNWGLYSNYQATATSGPYRAGTNITFRAIADGAVYIDAEESTNFVAVMNTSIIDLSNRVVTATNQTTVNSNTFNTAIISATNQTAVNSNTLHIVDTNLQDQITLLSGTAYSFNTNMWNTNLLMSGRLQTHITNYIASTNSHQIQIATNHVYGTNHETRITTLEDASAASTNTFDSLLVGKTNSPAAELTTNGTFTTDAGGWTCVTVYQSSAHIYINAGQTGTLTPSNALAITNGCMYLVSYNKGTTNGTVVVSLGGFTNAETSAGTHSIRYPVFNDSSGFVMTMTGGGSGNYIDDISVKRVTNGSATVAEDLGVGRNAYVDGTGTVRYVKSSYYYDDSGNRLFWENNGDTLEVGADFDVYCRTSSFYLRTLYVTNALFFRSTNIMDVITNSCLVTNDQRVISLPNSHRMSNIWVDADGDVGIGTNSILYDLQVGDGVGDEAISIVAGAGGGANLWLGDTADQSIGGISYDNGTDTMLIRSANGTAAKIDINRNWGFNHTNPLYRLHLIDGAIYAPTGIFPIVNGYSSNAWDVARQTTVNSTNAPVRIFGSNHVFKAFYDNIPQAYSNAMLGDQILVNPGYHWVTNLTLSNGIELVGNPYATIRLANDAAFTVPLNATNILRNLEIIGNTPTEDVFFMEGGQLELYNCMVTNLFTIATIANVSPTTNILFLHNTAVFGDTPGGNSTVFFYGASRARNVYGTSTNYNGEVSNSDMLDGQHGAYYRNFANITNNLQATNLFAGAGTTGRVTSTTADTNKYYKGNGTWDTPAGAGDYMADGSVSISAFHNGNNFGWTNAALYSGSTGEFTIVMAAGTDLLARVVGVNAAVGTNNVIATNAQWLATNVPCSWGSSEPDPSTATTGGTNKYLTPPLSRSFRITNLYAVCWSGTGIADVVRLNQTNRIADTGILVYTNVTFTAAVTNISVTITASPGDKIGYALTNDNNVLGWEFSLMGVEL